MHNNNYSTGLRKFGFDLHTAHKLELISQIVRIYSKTRLHYIAKRTSMQTKPVSSRNKLHKIVHFTGNWIIFVYNYMLRYWFEFSSTNNYVLTVRLIVNVELIKFLSLNRMSSWIVKKFLVWFHATARLLVFACILPFTMHLAFQLNSRRNVG